MTFIRMAMFVILSSVGLTANAAYINFDDYSINKFANQGADGSATTNAFGLELGLDVILGFSSTTLFLSMHLRSFISRSKQPETRLNGTELVLIMIIV